MHGLRKIFERVMHGQFMVMHDFMECMMHDMTMILLQL